MQRVAPDAAFRQPADRPPPHNVPPSRPAGTMRREGRRQIAQLPNSEHLSGCVSARISYLKNTYLMSAAMTKAMTTRPRR